LRAIIDFSQFDAAAVRSILAEHVRPLVRARLCFPSLLLGQRVQSRMNAWPVLDGMVPTIDIGVVSQVATMQLARTHPRECADVSDRIFAGEIFFCAEALL